MSRGRVLGTRHRLPYLTPGTTGPLLAEDRPAVTNHAPRAPVPTEPTCALRTRIHAQCTGGSSTAIGTLKILVGIDLCGFAKSRVPGRSVLHSGTGATNFRTQSEGASVVLRPCRVPLRACRVRKGAHPRTPAAWPVPHVSGRDDATVLLPAHAARDTPRDGLDTFVGGSASWTTAALRHRTRGRGTGGSCDE